MAPVVWIILIFSALSSLSRSHPISKCFIWILTSCNAVNIFLQDLEKIVTLSDWHKSSVSMSTFLTLRKFSHTFDIVTKIMWLFIHKPKKSVTKFSMSKIFNIETLDLCQSDNAAIFSHSWRKCLQCRNKKNYNENK